MALFVLVPGAGGMAWYWHRVVPLLGSAGHEVIAVDLPGDDRDAGLAAYADIVVFVNAMIPKPGETAGEWWSATGATEAREKAAARRGYAKEFDMTTYFLHDMPHSVLRTGPEQLRDEADTIFGEPCRFKHWHDVPIHVLAGRDDRFFPIEFQRRVARERVGKDIQQVPGGHLVALSNAEGLTERFLAYAEA